MLVLFCPGLVLSDVCLSWCRLVLLVCVSCSVLCSPSACCLCLCGLLCCPSLHVIDVLRLTMLFYCVLLTCLDVLALVLLVSIDVSLLVLSIAYSPVCDALL